MKMEQELLNLIPKVVIAAYQKIESSGFECFLVGGSVRDIIIKRNVKDWDLTTNATPEEILKLFPETFKLLDQDHVFFTFTSMEAELFSRDLS